MCADSTDVLCSFLLDSLKRITQLSHLLQPSPRLVFGRLPMLRVVRGAHRSPSLALHAGSLAGSFGCECRPAWPDD